MRIREEKKWAPQLLGAELGLGGSSVLWSREGLSAEAPSLSYEIL